MTASFWIRIALLVALAAAAGAVVYGYNNALRKAEKYRQQAESLQLVVDDMANQMKRTDAALVKREKERERLRKERDNARRELKQLLSQPEVRDWAQSSLPGPVLERLRRSAGSQGADGKAAAQPAR